MPLRIVAALLCLGGTLGASGCAAQIIDDGVEDESSSEELTSSCPEGQVLCGTSCVDPLASATHCGAKGACTDSRSASSDYSGANCAAGGGPDDPQWCNNGSCARFSDCSTGSCTRVVENVVKNYDVFVAAGRPSAPVHVKVVVASTGVIGSVAASAPHALPPAAFTTGALPAGSTVTLVNRGKIIGAGGAGGNGGNGSVGDSRPCARPGGPGGTAVRLTVPTVIERAGNIWGGGGGGGGSSAMNLTAGGGGGAGFTIGQGGAEATSSPLPSDGSESPAELAYCGEDALRRGGFPGENATRQRGGAGGVYALSALPMTARGGAGGDLGMPGQPGSFSYSTWLAEDSARGGAAGYAIRRGNQTISILDGSYATGTGEIRGTVGP